MPDQGGVIDAIVQDPFLFAQRNEFGVRES